MKLNDVSELMKSNPYLGYTLFFIFIFFWVLNQLEQSIPLLALIKSQVLLPLAALLKFKLVQKAAIKSDIQGRVNYALAPLSKEITNQRIKPLAIEWIKNSSVEKFIKEDKILVRIRPLKDQDDNILSVTQPYLEAVLLPHSSLLIADVQRKSIIHFTTKEIIGNNSRLLQKFHDQYYLPDCRKHKGLEDYFLKIEQIYKRGLFFSVAISAIEFASEKSRFKRSNLSTDFSDVLKYLLLFIGGLNKRDSSGNNPSNSSLWDYHGTNISFGLLLVAMPVKAADGNIKPYINRAKEHLKAADILFVAFANQERDFGFEVAHAIEDALPVRLLDELSSKYDYRGSKNGVVRIYLRA